MSYLYDYYGFYDLPQQEPYLWLRKPALLSHCMDKLAVDGGRDSPTAVHRARGKAGGLWLFEKVIASDLHENYGDQEVHDLLAAVK